MKLILTVLDYYISPDDIEQAMLEVRPTAMHDITLQPPKVKWDEIGGQDSVKKALQSAVENSLKVSRQTSIL
jgi:AAA family ATPase